MKKSDGGVEMQTRDGAAAAPTPNVIAGIASGPSEQGCSHMSSDIRAELTALLDWIDQERSKFGALDGYDYRSGEEYGLRRVAIELDIKIAALASADEQLGCGFSHQDCEKVMCEACGGNGWLVCDGDSSSHLPHDVQPDAGAK